MVTVTKAGEGAGIELVQYENEIYISAVNNGPFYETSVDKGDRILSINGKKVKDIKTVAFARELMDNKDKITLFVMRPDPVKDRGYKWVMSNC